MWHIDCLRCNGCGNLLDSDEKLLLLGDGSLLCNQCTYDCNVCWKKIEHLAILASDRALCAECFKCRNCKKYIESFQYGMTPQGIFCVKCHEYLMARRKDKKHLAQFVAYRTTQQTAQQISQQTTAPQPNFSFF